MKTIIIAAGYATRLYPLTENFPKPLLRVGGSTILDRMLADIDTIPEIDGHIIVTNHRFAPIFGEWKANSSYSKPVTVIDDGTSTNDTRLGAVRDLLLAIKTQDIDDDIMVLAADNILDFSLRGFVDYFKEKETSVIMCHHEPELRKLQRTGVVAVDGGMKVTGMQEKPEKPASSWAVPPFYIYSRKDLPLIRGCMEHGCAPDAPGNLARYLTGVTDLHAWPMPGTRFDIGSMDSYLEAQERFGGKRQESRVKSQESRVKGEESRVKGEEPRVKGEETRGKGQEARGKGEGSRVKSQEPSFLTLGDGLGEPSVTK